VPILERYVLRESVLPFLLGFALVTFLFVIDFLFDYLDLILSKGIPPLMVAELFLLALGWITALSFPCGVLVAALMTFGRLAQDNEVTAMRAMGINVGRILRGPLLAGVAMAGLLTAFNNYVLPETNHRFANLSLSIHRKSPTARIQPGVFIDDFENYSLLVRQIDDRTGLMSDVTIYDYSEGESPTTILARRGRMRYIDRGATLRLELEDGEIHDVPGPATEGKFRRMAFDKQTLYLHNPGAVLKRTDRRSRGEREMNIALMQDQIDRLVEQKQARLRQLAEKTRAEGYGTYQEFLDRAGEARGPLAVVRGWFGGREALPDTASLSAADRKLLEATQIDRMEIENLERRIDNYEVEIHKKFAIPFACLAFVLVGGPLGIRMGKGGFANMAIAVGFFLVYYLMLIGGEQLADRRLFSPLLAMWLPNLILGAIGVYLTASVMGIGPSRGMR
jgi:lipopolysaccharide export system permease protein